MAEQIATRYGVPAFYDVVRRDARQGAARRRPHHDAAAVAPPAGAHGDRRRLPRLRREAAHAEPRRLQGGSIEPPRSREEAHHRLHLPLRSAGARDARALAEGVLGDVVHVESFYGYNLAGPVRQRRSSATPSHWVHRLPGKLFHNNIDHLLNKLVEFIDDDASRRSRAAFQLRRREPALRRRRATRCSTSCASPSSAARVTAYGTFSSHIKPAAHFVRVYGDEEHRCTSTTCSRTRHARAARDAAERDRPPGAGVRSGAGSSFARAANNARRFARERLPVLLRDEPALRDVLRLASSTARRCPSPTATCSASRCGWTRSSARSPSTGVADEDPRHRRHRLPRRRARRAPARPRRERHPLLRPRAGIDAATGSTRWPPRYPDARVDATSQASLAVAGGDAERAVDGVDVVYHLAASLRGARRPTCSSTPWSRRRTCSRRSAPPAAPKVVLVSSFGVYGVAEPAARRARRRADAARDRARASAISTRQAKLRQELLFREYRGEERLGPGGAAARRHLRAGGSAPFSTRVGLNLFGLFLHLGGGNLLPLIVRRQLRGGDRGRRPRDRGRGPGLQRGRRRPADLRASTWRATRSRCSADPQHLGAVPRAVARSRSRSSATSRWSKGQLPAIFTPYKSATAWGGNRFDNSKLKGLGWKQIGADGRGDATHVRVAARVGDAHVSGTVRAEALRIVPVTSESALAARAG